MRLSPELPRGVYVTVHNTCTLVLIPDVIYQCRYQQWSPILSTDIRMNLMTHFSMPRHHSLADGQQGVRWGSCQPCCCSYWGRGAGQEYTHFPLAGVQGAGLLCAHAGQAGGQFNGLGLQRTLIFDKVQRTIQHQLLCLLPVRVVRFRHT